MSGGINWEVTARPAIKHLSTVLVDVNKQKMDEEVAKKLADEEICEITGLSLQQLHNIREGKDIDSSVIYYEVQIIKRISLGHRTYVFKTEEVRYFEEEDLKKAVSLWKKRVANRIIRHQTFILDSIPYYKDEEIFGEKEFDFSENTEKLIFRRSRGEKPVETVELGRRPAMKSQA